MASAVPRTNGEALLNTTWDADLLIGDVMAYNSGSISVVCY